VPGARMRAARGELCFGTIDSWLVYKLTDGRVHATDVTNASRTMLLNLATLAWDDEMLVLFDVPRAMLPEVRDSAGDFGETTVLGRRVPILGVAGDQQAAAFGQACFKPGDVKSTYGTGCFALVNTGGVVPHSQNRLLATSAYRIGGDAAYAVEGSIFIAGAVVQWLRDGLGIIKHSAEVEKLAATVPDNGGVYLVPAFAGLGAPHWDQYARGSISGLTRGSNAGHIARAALESIAFQVADVLSAMQADSKIKLKELRVDGGACANNLLMQFQADLLSVPVVRPAIRETTALGAAYLAGLTVGFWRNQTEIATQWKVDRTFEPAVKPAQREKLRAQWTRALERAKKWEEAS
jgi:glycerol kinase